MEKQLARYTYWVGLLCVLVSGLWRIGMSLSSAIHGRVGALEYSSFWKAGAVFLLISVASVQYTLLQQKPEEKPAEKEQKIAHAA